MLLFKEDWNREEYRNWIIDYDTPNESFLHYVGLLENLGIENRYWPLALRNPLLKGIDPHDPDLSQEEMLMVIEESTLNFWYFIREVIRIPVQGSLKPGMFKAHRGNMGLFWTFHNHVTSMILMPRQQGKTLAVNCIWVWILDLAGRNTTIGLYTKDDNLRVVTVKQVKDIIEELPSYFNVRTRHDTNNTEMITNKALGNTYRTAVAQASPKAALNVYRGHSIPLFHSDETAFSVNNRLTIPSMLAAQNTARKNAAASGNPYGVIFSTTAGYMNSDTGIYAREIYDESLPWTERLLDCKDQADLYETIRNNNRTRLVSKDPEFKSRPPLQILLEFNHRQLGVSDEDFLETIENAKAQGDAVEADFFNKWVRGSDDSPIPPEILEEMEKSIERDPYVTVEQGFSLRWYVGREEVEDCLRGRRVIVGSDTSDAVGNDSISLVFVDLYSGELLGCGDYCNVNLYQFANWLSSLIIRFTTSTFILERKSSGTTILDILFIKLMENDIDPLKRIYTRVVDEMKELPMYGEFAKTNHRFRDKQLYIKYKSMYGYTTTGTGVHARDNVYFRAFHSVIHHLKHVVRDKRLYDQLCNLIRKGERIDHKPGHHDDIVFGWLLCYWFATQAKNKEFYGIEPSMIFRKIREKQYQEAGGEEGEKKRRKQAEYLNKLEAIRKSIGVTTNPIQLVELKNMYNRIVPNIEDKSIEIFDFDSLVKDTEMERKLRRY